MMARSCTRPARPANAPGYAAELGRPVLGKKKATNSVHRYQNLQDILGEHQDAVVAADLPRRMAAGTAGHPDENWFTYGLLYARELDLAEHSRRLAHHWAPWQPPSDTHSARSRARVTRRRSPADAAVSRWFDSRGHHRSSNSGELLRGARYPSTESSRTERVPRTGRALCGPAAPVA